MLTTLAAQNWGLFVLRGVLALILGVLAFVVPGPTLAALVIVFAAYAFVDGIFAIGSGLAAPNGPSWWLVLGGVLGVAIGVYTAFNPQITAIALVLLIGAFAVVRGIAEVVTAVSLRDILDSTWLYVLSGIASVVFGAFLLVAPGDGALAVLWVVGFYATLAGVMYIAIGVRLRGIAKAVAPAATPATSRS
jgi:uncharacterized membrane protein HdeD (DUF308 family)